MVRAGDGRGVPHEAHRRCLSRCVCCCCCCCRTGGDGEVEGGTEEVRQQHVLYRSRQLHLMREVGDEGRQPGTQQWAMCCVANGLEIALNLAL